MGCQKDKLAPEIFLSSDFFVLHLPRPRSLAPFRDYSQHFRLPQEATRQPYFAVSSFGRVPSCQLRTGGPHLDAVNLIHEVGRNRQRSRCQNDTAAIRYEYQVIATEAGNGRGHRANATVLMAQSVRHRLLRSDTDAAHPQSPPFHKATARLRSRFPWPAPRLVVRILSLFDALRTVNGIARSCLVCHRAEASAASATPSRRSWARQGSAAAGDRSTTALKPPRLQLRPRAVAGPARAQLQRETASTPR